MTGPRGWIYTTSRDMTVIVDLERGGWVTAGSHFPEVVLAGRNQEDRTILWS
jgi:hypothetical protein